MNWDRIEGNWKQFKGQVHAKWGKLTDDNLTVINGRREILLGKLQEAYGLSKDEAERQIHEWTQSVDHSSAKGDGSEPKPRTMNAHR